MKNYFLGANSADGFYSLYDGFCPSGGGNFLWILKGGPGCGKSTFMKTIAAAAENAGLAVERVWCSGDPDSLDGVFIPAKKVGYMDGTAPHAMEPRFPAADSLCLDLGQFYDVDAIRPLLPQIRELYGQYKSCYRRAYQLLSAASEKIVPALWQRQTPACFCRAITCRGLVDLIESDPIPVTRKELDDLAQSAVSRGTRVLDLRSPLHPLRSEGILLEEDGLCYRCSEEALSLPAVFEELREAKRLHDLLESVYHPHVDFAGVEKFAGNHCKKLNLDCKIGKNVVE